jgi:hypothetical protein
MSGIAKRASRAAHRPPAGTFIFFFSVHLFFVCRDYLLPGCMILFLARVRIFEYHSAELCMCLVCSGALLITPCDGADSGLVVTSRSPSANWTVQIDRYQDHERLLDKYLPRILVPIIRCLDRGAAVQIFPNVINRRTHGGFVINKWLRHSIPPNLVHRCPIIGVAVLYLIYHLYSLNRIGWCCHRNFIEPGQRRPALRPRQLDG